MLTEVVLTRDAVCVSAGEVALLSAVQTILTTPALLQVVTFVSLVLFTRQGLEPTLKWLYKQWCVRAASTFLSCCDAQHRSRACLSALAFAHRS